MSNSSYMERENSIFSELNSLNGYRTDNKYIQKLIKDRVKKLNEMLFELEHEDLERY